MKNKKFFLQIFASILFTVLLSVFAIHYLKLEFLWELTFILIITTLISYWFSRLLSKPIEEIRNGAEKFARGDFSEELSVNGSEEIIALTDSLNKMARELNKRIEKISLQKNEQEAMFLSMKEGVLAINSKEEIIRINKAALKFFKINATPAELKKRKVYEVIRNKDMLDFIRASLNAPEHIEKEIRVFGEKERVLLVNADPLFNSSDEKIGTIIVMNNITRIKELDKMRQEFVANVSHELKTPITSIIGYVETLLTTENIGDETRTKFLEIINRQSKQLNALIEDLLHLAKLDASKQISLKETLLYPLLSKAANCCDEKRKEKNIEIKIICDKSLKLSVNEALLERALTNLIDNAIKYSDLNGKILIEAEAKNNSIEVSVRDWGTGIAPEHHGRLFERFYRVDKGRSREMGGTGLGLAIVKHIALAHGGKVRVESQPGQGSKFTIILPKQFQTDKSEK